MTNAARKLEHEVDAATPGWAEAAAALPAGERLTIGIIARNGLPFLKDCLDALPPEAVFAGALDIILVDSASTDGTTEAMQAVGARRRDTRVYRLEGTVNASVARNVIVDNARPGFLLLLDGDMVVDPSFIAAGVRRVLAGEADAVVGALREQRFDAENRPDGDVYWRHLPEGPRYVRLTGGALMLGPAARVPGLRYDEEQKMCEDWDFALRLSRRRRILRIPEPMALHLTHYYFSPQRRFEFIRDLRPRNFGFLLRKHLLYPARLTEVMKLERGIFFGAAAQAVVIAALLAGLPWLAAAALLGLGLDGLRTARRGLFVQWAATRIAAPWIAGYGMVRPERAAVRYDVRQIA